MEHPKISKETRIGIVHFGPDTLVKELLESIPEVFFPCIRVINHNQSPLHIQGIAVDNTGENRGFAAGVNRLIRQAMEDGCKYFIGLNNDLSLMPEALQEIVSVLNTQEVSLLQGLLLKDEDTISQGRNRLSRLCLFSYSPERGKPLSTVQRYPELMPTDFVCGAFFGLNLDIVAPGVSDLDEQFFCYFEDIEWSERLIQLGYRIGFCHKARAIHPGSMSSGGGMSRAGVHLRLAGIDTYLRVTRKDWKYSLFTWMVQIPRLLLLWIRDGMR